ncbi:Spy/CpxP family protein refolding chaperone [Castellaniella sp.]|uniref:Spy/CpxP family protein refolding chaperone n=1 Tax=Castellaniella sp. TaxID=1955812 RepID=UPI002AFFFBD9|nr:Spy/CpxP family protein refolding chaperone [Castellaniella sp.]
MTIQATRTFSALALAAAIIAAPLAVNAASGPHAEGARHHQKADHQARQHGDRWLRGLNLSQDQQDQIFKIRHDQEQAVYDQKKAIKAAAGTLRELSQSDAFDQAKAKQAADTLGQAQGQLALLRAQSMAQIRAVLTPEQRQQMAKRHQRKDKGESGMKKS